MTDADQPIDLMSASLEEIQTLHGFGEKTAEKIITMRSLMGTLSIQLLSTILGFPTAALQSHLHFGNIETLPGDKNRTTDETIQLPTPSKEPRDRNREHIIGNYYSLILSEKKESENLRHQLKNAESDSRRHREREMLLLREGDEMRAAFDTFQMKEKRQDGERRTQEFKSSEQRSEEIKSRHPTYGIHRGKTSQSRHLTSTPQDVKPMVPHRVYKQPTSVREEAPTKPLHPYYQDKHSSTTHTHSQNKETTISRSWGTDRETSQDKNIDTWKHSSFQEINSFSSQLDEDSSSIPRKTEDFISSSDQEAPRTDERSHSGQSTRSTVEERPQYQPSARTGSGATDLASNLDKIIEDPEKSYTFVDTRPPEDDHENNGPTVSNNSRESMAAQDEIAFLTSSTDNIDNYKNITDLRLQTEKADIEDYIRVFERGNKDDMLMIGSIGLEVVQEEERRLQEKHVTYWESEAFWEEDRKWRIQIFDVQAKRRADGQLDIIGGNFNCPMLHGEMDHHVEKHETLAFVIAIDFNRWMCNLYFEIVKLPRFLA